MGHARKRGERDTGGCEGRRERQREGTSETDDGGETRGRHGAPKEQGGKTKAARDSKGQNPGEWGETLGAVRPPEWTLSPTEWNGERGGPRPPE